MKQCKITDEDWRNRDKYPQYKAAVEDIFRLTSTPFAPDNPRERRQARYARVVVPKIINDARKGALRETGDRVTKRAAVLNDRMRIRALERKSG